MKYMTQFNVCQKYDLMKINNLIFFISQLTILKAITCNRMMKFWLVVRQGSYLKNRGKGLVRGNLKIDQKVL